METATERQTETAERKPASAAPRQRQQQRVYIKISAATEQSGALERLQALLAGHSGALNTVLFYERNQKLIALSDMYKVKPSPELFAAIEELLGAGTVAVK